MTSESHEQNVDRPRQGANRSGAGSPITQLGAQEVSSMTDAGSPGMEWVPRFGMLEVPRERAELIRGLFELAAFVADHSELPLPDVQARFFARYSADAPEMYGQALAVVEQLAEALAVEPSNAAGQVELAARMGPVEVLSIAYTPAWRAAFEARHSYTGNVVTESVDGGAR